MSIPGPKPTPTAILRLRGSPEASKRKNEPQPDRSIPPCPEWLSEEAKAVWGIVVPQLSSIGVIGGIDSQALCRYCQLWGRWKQAELFLQSNGNADADGEVFAEVAISHRLSEQLTRLEVEFGMTPSSRTRLRVDKSSTEKQPDTAYFSVG